MKIRTQLAVMFFCAVFVLLPIVKSHSATTWYTTDNVDDVELYDNDLKQSTGDYRNEIDIEKIELNENYIVISTQNQPVEDVDHLYILYIYWHDYPFKIIELNYTKIEFGEGKNHVYTQLYISSVEITDDIYINIYIDGKAIWCPIPLFNHIDNTTAEHIEGGALYYINKAEGDYYFDEIKLGTITSGTPGYTFTTTITCIIFIALIWYSRKKSK